MPMTARCGAAALCRGAATVRQLPHTRRVVGRAQSACSCSCMRGCGRKLSCISLRGFGRKRKGVDENSWQSRQLHMRFQRNTMKAADCVDRTEQRPQGVGWLCGTHCWACLGLDCHEFRMQLQLHLHALCAIHTTRSFPPLVSCAATLTVAAPRHSAAAPHRAVMGIKRRPVKRPVQHACAEAPRAPRN
jgi:hypothetical protein